MDLQRLKGEMVAKGMTQAELAEKLELTTHGLNRKLNGKSQFTVGEARQIAEILELSDPASIFFAPTDPNMQR